MTAKEETEQNWFECASASKAELDLETKLMCEKHKQLKKLLREKKKHLLLGGTKSDLASRLCMKRHAVKILKDFIA